MKTTRSTLAAVLAAAAAALTGCPNDTCSQETPQVSNVPANGCTVGAGQPVTYELRLCPDCNQSAGSCTADLSATAGGYIYLNVTSQACTSNSCPAPSCPTTGATTCSFTAPNTPNVQYNVVIPDGQGSSYTRTLDVVASGTPASCPIASAAPTTF
jgi:FlaG/FlaF family flagellin (archaellin)